MGCSLVPRVSHLLRAARWETLGTRLDGMLLHHRVTPSIRFTVTHLYTWVERSTMRVKCFAQKHDTVCSAKARTRTTGSEDNRTNHETTAPPMVEYKGWDISLYNNPRYSRILIGSCLWSIIGQMHDWRHHYRVFASAVLRIGIIFYVTGQKIR